MKRFVSFGSTISQLSNAVKGLSLVRNVELKPFQSVRKYASISVDENRKMITTPSSYLHSLNVRLNKGSIKRVKKVGRGDRNGKGKTSGRGMKGYKARASKARATPGFEGGQSGILKATPQFGSPLRYKISWQYIF